MTGKPCGWLARGLALALWAGAALAEGPDGANALVAAEAYVDDGLAVTALALDAGVVPSFAEALGELDLSALAPGVHTVFLRFQDQTGAWSPPLAQSLLVQDGSGGGSGSAGRIAAAEVFFDTDPGQGAGIALPPPVDGAFDGPLETALAEVDLSGLEPGNHAVYFRVRDGDGHWSRPIAQGLYLSPDLGGGSGPGASRIVAAEVFVDSDPGPGLGWPLAAAGGAEPDALLAEIMDAVPLTDLAPGIHSLYFRVRNGAGVWSRTLAQSLLVPTGQSGGGGSGAVTIVAAEVAVDGGPFQSAPAADGAFGGLIESVDLAAPVQIGVNHAAWVRFIDSRGRVSGVPSEDEGETDPYDSDWDGLPDTWEREHLGTLDLDGRADPDGDGLTNADEFLRGTDPLVPDAQGLLTISGFVRGTDGQGLPGLNLCLSQGDGPEDCAALTDAVGHYLLGAETGLSPGIYRVRPRAPTGGAEFGFAPVSRPVTLAAIPIAAIDFTARPLAVDLLAPPGGGTYRANDRVTLAWSGNGAVDRPMVLAMRRDAVPAERTEPLADDPDWVRLVLDTANDGAEPVTIPTGLTPAADWRFTVGYAGTAVEARSAVPFAWVRSPDLQVAELIAAPERGLAFDGSDDRVTLANGDGRFDLDTWTIEAWVQPDADADGGDGAIVWKTLADGATEFGYALLWRGDHCVAQVVDGATGTVFEAATSPLDAGATHAVAASFDGQSLRLFVDGLADGELALPAPVVPPRGGGPLLFGHGGSGAALLGTLDEVRLWSFARDAAEIARDRDRRLRGTETGLVGHWTFDEPDGDLALDRVADGRDGLLGDGDPTLAPPRVLGLPSAPLLAEPGDPIEVQWRVTNAGEAEVGGALVDRLWLSADALPGGDTLLAAVSADGQLPLAPGAGYRQASVATLPAGLAEGDWYLLLQTDATGNQTESDETNNVAAVPLRMRAPPPVDLAPSAVTAPVEAVPGAPVEVRWTTTNLGSGTAVAPWREAVILAVPGADDRLLGSLLIDTDLAPGTSAERVATLSLPALLGVSGPVRLGVLTDGDGVLADEDPANDRALAGLDTELARALALVLPVTQVAEDATAPVGATLSRSGETAAELAVSLWSDDPDAVDLPSDVVLPAGVATLEVPIQPLQDGRAAGDRMATITAAASDHRSAMATLLVVDSGRLIGDFPDLMPDALTAPTEGLTGSAVTLDYLVENSGDAEAVGANADADQGFPGSWQERVYLSRDAALGDDILVGTYAFVGTLPAGQHYGRGVSVTLPELAGDWWLLVQVDAIGRVFESAEGNNLAVSTAPITVLPAYQASVSTDLDLATAGTPIPLAGRAWMSDTGAPAVGVRVDVHLRVRGTERVISGITDATGAFAATFTPLPGEAGEYSIGAAHPGQSDWVVQDHCVLQGLRVLPVSQSLQLVEGGSGTVRFALRNLSDLPLTGLTATPLEVPDSLAVQATLGAATLAGAASGTLDIAVTALDAALASGTLRVRIGSDQGVEAIAALGLSIVALQAELTADTDRLVASVVAGEQRTVTLRLTNRGSLPSGALTVALPDLPWLRLADPGPLPGLAPGESRTLDLVLTPPVDVALGPYTGQLVVAGTGAALTLPFELRLVASGTGDLTVTVVDEYFYYDASQPRVAGAEVRLRDYFTGLQVAAGLTGADGTLHLTGLRNDYYLLEVGEPVHTGAGRTILIEPGPDNAELVFLSRQTVRYDWQVREIALTDRYRVSVQSTFETEVPAPVVVFDPPGLDISPLTGPGQSMQIDLAVSNRGLIAARNLRLEPPEMPGYRVTPLVASIDELPAQSSLTIPVLVERLDLAAQPALALAVTSPSADIPGGYAAADWGQGFAYLVGCAAWSMPAVWEYVCGPSLVEKELDLPIYRSFEPCPISPSETSRTKACGNYCGPQPSNEQPSGDDPDSDDDWDWRPEWRPDDPNNLGPGLPELSRDACEVCIKAQLGALAGCVGGSIPLPDAVSCTVGAWSCVTDPPAADDSLRDIGLKLLGCVRTGATCVGHSIPFANLFFCAADVQDANRLCEPASGPSTLSARILGQTVSATTATVGGSLLEPVLQSAQWLQDQQAWLHSLLDDEVWFSEAALAGQGAFLTALGEAAGIDSDRGPLVSDAERTGLLLSALPRGVAETDLDRFIARWNRTVDYWSQGILGPGDLPAGADPDFVALDGLADALAQGADAEQAAEAAGYASPADALSSEAWKVAETDLGGAGVCAVVKLQLSQDLVLARQGFEASLELDNTTEQPLSEIAVEVRIIDSDGQSANERFGITEPLLVNLDRVDGTGQLAAGATGTAIWTLAPQDAAAPSGPVDYFVGGTLTYQEGGYAVSVNLLPARITVQPNARLTVDYFHQRDVYADDPFTARLEPSIPYSLGILVRNTGAGTARGLHIDSGRPRIIDNEKGLAISFDILAAQLGGESLSPSLTLDLGELAPGAVKVGRWLLRSSLQGHFTHYQATFTHLDPLGILDPLVDAVAIHEMLQPVAALGVRDDGLPDFLVNDVADTQDLPDTLYLSDGNQVPVGLAVGAASWDGAPSVADPTVSLQVDLGSGFRYLRTADPGGGLYRLVRALRSDGRELPVDVDIWQTDRTFPGVQQPPVREHNLHLLDDDSTGVYALTYVPIPIDFDPVAAQRVVVGSPLAFRVAASHPNGALPSVTAAGLPRGARLVAEPDSGAGRAGYTFEWTPEAADAGTHEVVLRAGIESIESVQTVSIAVCPLADTDCDGMADAWELAQFGALDRDGTGDFDGDGISDLDQYLASAGTTLRLAPGLNLIAYPYAVSTEHADCRALLTAFGANGPTDSLARLNAASGRVETCTLSDGTVFPIVTGEAYAVRVEAAHSLSLQGTPVCTAPDLVAGLNLRGHPLPAAALTCYGWLTALGPAGVTAIERLDPLTGRFAGCGLMGDSGIADAAGLDFPILIGEGYRLSASASGPLVLPGCP